MYAEDEIKLPPIKEVSMRSRTFTLQLFSSASGEKPGEPEFESVSVMVQSIELGALQIGQGVRCFGIVR